MIITLTCNPAIDCFVRADEIALGKTNRAASEAYRIGGKGINTSLVLSRLGVPTRACGFAGGFTGEKILRDLAAEGVETDFVMLERGETRINLKITSGKTETELNAPGPEIGQTDAEALLGRLGACGAGDCLVLSGSMQKSLQTQSFYEKAAQTARANGAEIAVDTTGETLLSLLRFRPLLIKPNLDELALTVSLPERTLPAIIRAAETLHQQGAQNVLVSMGAEGALLVCEEGAYLAPRLGLAGETVKGTVGAGDSAVAGFLWAVAEGVADPTERLARAVYCATASVYAEELATAALVNRVESENRNPIRKC